MSWSPTQKSLEWCRRLGYTAEVVEKTIPRTYIKKDLFGFIDIVAIKEGETLGVQATSMSNMAARVTKIMDSDLYHTVKDAGWKIEVHAWERRKPPRIERL